jgi:hypothetical protein
MSKSNEATRNGEIEKVRDYLKDSKKNIARLEKGKKPRRKLRFIIAEHKFSFTLLALLLATTPFIPLMLPKTPPYVPPPFYESVELTVNLIDSNFTDQEGYPVYEKTEANTSSELLILSSLTNSMLLQAGYLPKNEEVHSKISLINEILENDTFRDIENIEVDLNYSEQILGIYTLIQAYFSLMETNHSFSFLDVKNAYTNLINNYYNYDEDLIVQPNSNCTFIIDQALAVWLFSTYKLLFQRDRYHYYDYDAEDYVDSILYSVSEKFVNISTGNIYSEYNITSGEKSILVDLQDLMYLTAGLSRSQKFGSNFFYSSYYTHQQIINNYIDGDWLVHETDKADDILKIENQAYFTLISHLMNLNSVGSELVNSTTRNYLYEDGFYNDLDSQEVTAESCLYGLLIFTSKEWSKIQNDREYIETTEPTTAASWTWGLIAVFLIVIVVRLRRRKKEKIW